MYAMLLTVGGSLRTTPFFRAKLSFAFAGLAWKLTKPCLLYPAFFKG
ncbi:MAG: hypothetical protein AVDCRST_MAG56-2309 [uncultured Cytophagales bacterium]|uniref:Uncharacterized protein n=1 Tax=uncultured Cytophagales bacterium TaxID=158755 RepID=A0A6J4IMX8_9SPHI|nr:MAG: hypothetical protein AVDCRST_MAG56-2309 [uncultured Cytophagales bacterium]